MRARPAVAAFALALGGCTLEAPAVSPPPSAPAGGACDAQGAQGAVGRPYDTALGDQLQRQTGAERVRVVRPG
ncbi:MAG TPA: I78 family peptidase inhibitor, partial [Ramlibacter sp.]|nr:I78 family peptidase inhibitor [Ramlibacter sp.]